MPLIPQRPVYPSASPAEAISAGYFAQVRYLLETGGQTNPADTRERGTGRTPLILCSLVRDRGWSVSLARLLLEKGARVGLKDRRGMNALHYACAHGREELAELYLQAIDYKLDDADCYGNTAMHYAVRGGRLGIVEALAVALQRLQLACSPPNREGVTPLMLAYMANRLDIAAKLLDAGAESDAVDAFGKATSVYYREAVERLREAEEAAAAKAAGRKLRFDDVDGWRRYQQRLRSAPASRRCGSAVSTASAGVVTLSPTFKEAQRELRRTRMYQPESAELIVAASPLDRRNDPNEVFRTSPADFFGPTARQRQRQGGELELSIAGVRVNSAARRRRVQSAGAPLNRRQQSSRDEDSSDSDRSGDSRELRKLGCGGGGGGLARGAAAGPATMATLFHHYEFHCSSLYRPPPRPADPATYVHDFAARFASPSMMTDAEAGGSGGGSAGGGGGGGSDTIGGRRRKDTSASAAGAAGAAGRKGKRGGPSAAAAAAALVAATAADGIKKKSGAGGAAGRISRAALSREE